MGFSLTMLKKPLFQINCFPFPSFTLNINYLYIAFHQRRIFMAISIEGPSDKIREKLPYATYDVIQKDRPTTG